MRSRRRRTRCSSGESRRTVVVADGSKLGHDLLARIVDVRDVDELITDESADPDAVEALRRAGLAVTVV